MQHDVPLMMHLRPEEQPLGGGVQTKRKCWEPTVIKNGVERKGEGGIKKLGGQKEAGKTSGPLKKGRERLLSRESMCETVVQKGARAATRKFFREHDARQGGFKGLERG